jgi:hypothetical protein
MRIFVGAMMQYNLDNNSYHAHRDGPGQHFPLTTPVPYLNGFLPDRFQDRADIARQNGYQYSMSYYHWIPCNTHVDWWPKTGLRGHPSVADAHTQQYGGLVDAWGPAGVRGGPPYDPSNGLVSLGGFMRMVPAANKIQGHNQKCD